MAKEQQKTAPDGTAAPAKPAAGAKAGAAPAKRKKEFKKKREKRVVPHGVVHVAASFNNTQITITDTDGRTLCWSSAGAIGFKGSRKGTPYAAQQASLNAAGNARDQYGMKMRSPRTGSRLRPRIRGTRPGCGGIAHRGHSRRHADSAQRLPSAEAPPRLTRCCSGGPQAAIGSTAALVYPERRRGCAAV